MIYGYARVSTTAQGRDGNSLEEQVAALEKYGCQKIIKEAFTGKTMERPAFLSLLEQLEEGDTLVVSKLDRFARTAIEGVQTVRELFERNIKVHILNMGLIENTLTGNLILTVMLAFAEYERGMIVERTQTGKMVARQDANFREGRPISAPMTAATVPPTIRPRMKTTGCMASRWLGFTCCPCP